VKSLLSNSNVNKKKRGERTLSFTDKLYALIFSEISLGLVLPIIFGILILFFPTWLYDLLEPVNIAFPDFLWGGPEIPLEHILTQGVSQGLLACAIPVFLGLAWNRWAGGASGFLLGVFWVMASFAQYNQYGYFFPTLDWLGQIVAGMLAGYIAGALMTRAKMRGNDTLKQALIAAVVAAVVATVFVTTTYIWYADMFKMSTLPPHGYGGTPEGMPAEMSLELWDSITYNYFINGAIYGVWAIIGAFISRVARWFR
jgi:uncharacterized membrane protein YeaQ/YmgE (transglycosylase-associated protein family)